jgi:putative lipase involved disintegration of autophagic bodies
MPTSDEIIPETGSTVREVLSEADKAREGESWRHMYPQYNINNLDTHGVMAIEGRSYVFVENGHPVIHLLHQNADILGADINTQPMIDNEFYKVERQCFKVCCSTLRYQVLSQF